jgi:NAD+ kinase
MTEPSVSPPRRIAVTFNPHHAGSHTVASNLVAAIKERGVEAIIDDETDVKAGLDGADLLICLGGDGTVLRNSHRAVHAGVPLLGVNLGRLGFLTEVDRSDLTTALDQLLSGRARVDTRAMLIGRVERQTTALRERLSLNDIVVTRSALSRMTEMDIDVDGQFVCHVKADGLIVATATGSTAYNLSAGGPIVHPGVDALVLTPIAPHTLTHRPLVLPATAEIRLRPLLEPQSEVIVTFDGQYGVPLAPGDEVRIQRAPRALRLVRLASRTYFDMLREKLKWGNP